MISQMLRPNLDVAPAVNVVLRAVASSLLKGDASFTSLGCTSDGALGTAHGWRITTVHPRQNVRDLVQSETQLSGSDLAVLAACIAYLRDRVRVGSPRDLSMPAAKKTEAQKEQARPKRPKWRLCFRLDRRMATAKESLEDLAPKYQRDFFLTVIDPPWHGIFKDHPPAPFFASRSACHVADLMASRHMISQLPGRSYEGKAVCVIGAECMTAGLVCAMLGAKVMFVCERNLESYFQHNVRLFRRDTLDYTKTKGKTLLVTSCSPGRNASFGAAALCEKLQVPSIDMIVLTELSAARVLGDVGGLLGRRTEATASGFFRMLNNLVPARSCCKTLVVCDQSSAEIMEEPRFKGDASISTSTAPSWLDENVPPGLAAVLPMDWQARTFCQLPQNIQVIWLERPDAEVVRQRPAPLVNRPPMPPMGATSSRCGCGGHLQSPLLGQRVENKEWFVKNAQLKEAGGGSGVKRRIHMKTPKWLPYSAPADGAAKDVWDALTLMDASMDGSGKIILLYSGYVISPGERDREFQAGWNREHVWPRSKGGLSTRSPGPGTDLHNLHAADISVNSARGNKDFDDLVETDDGVQVVVDSSPPPGYDSMKRLCLVSEDAWAPGDAAKGTVARALMYMACMYADHGLRLVEGHTAEGHLQLGNLSAIRRWAGAFPPSQREKRRNDLAESLQENRNPFIDDPDLCSAVAW
ncbi:Extracellular ribonuclease [Durusdinium trenchii]|uniref:Extracellular ribonuclease n=1 Tax=Durusdinium trenchii TaxID=1381693 RepID=A0ABP0JSY4_9DINO